MLKFSSIMIGTSQVEEMAAFYEKLFERPADMADGGYYGWAAGEGYVTLGAHSEVNGANKEPARVIFNFETADVKAEAERIKGIGATVIKDAYNMTAEGEEGNMWIATFADPDGNYFQLMTPWE